MTRQQMIDTLTNIKKCFGSYCPDKDCEHCAYAVDADLAEEALEEALKHVSGARICPFAQLSCDENCALYNHVLDVCSLVRKG